MLYWFCRAGGVPHCVCIIFNRRSRGCRIRGASRFRPGHFFAKTLDKRRPVCYTCFAAMKTLIRMSCQDLISPARWVEILAALLLRCGTLSCTALTGCARWVEILTILLSFLSSLLSRASCRTRSFLHVGLNHCWFHYCGGCIVCIYHGKRVRETGLFFFWQSGIFA